MRTAAAVAEPRRTDPAAGDLPVRLPRVATCQFQVQPVTLEELHCIVMDMNRSSACGAVGLSMRFVKQCFDAAGHVILSIVNTSLVAGIVPESLKLSIVHPIYKSASALNDPSSFRPISIVPCLAKIVERVLHVEWPVAHR